MKLGQAAGNLVEHQLENEDGSLKVSLQEVAKHAQVITEGAVSLSCPCGWELGGAVGGGSAASHAPRATRPVDTQRA